MMNGPRRPKPTPFCYRRKHCDRHRFLLQLAIKANTRQGDISSHAARHGSESVGWDLQSKRLTRRGSRLMLGPYGAARCGIFAGMIGQRPIKPEEVDPDWFQRLGASPAMQRLKHLARPTKGCLFCNAKANTREHVWPVWLLEQFTAPTFGTIGTVGDTLYLDAKQKEIRIRCVCKPCNTGWMSDLEKEAAPVLSLMARDFSLSLDQRDLIAAWAVKTAMVWDHFGPRERRPFYLDWDRADLRAARRIPENTKVWLARHGGTPRLWSSAADATADPRHPMPDTTTRAIVTTMVFGKLCIQVLSHRTLMADVQLNADPLPGPWNDCTVAVWPPTQHRVVDWRPRLTLDREVSFDAFLRRWPRYSDGG
jgi:hypothetical protein